MSCFVFIKYALYNQKSCLYTLYNQKSCLCALYKSKILFMYPKQSQILFLCPVKTYTSCSCAMHNQTSCLDALYKCTACSNSKCYGRKLSVPDSSVDEWQQFPHTFWGVHRNMGTSGFPVSCSIKLLNNLHHNNFKSSVSPSPPPTPGHSFKHVSLTGLYFTAPDDRYIQYISAEFEVYLHAYMMYVCTAIISVPLYN